VIALDEHPQLLGVLSGGVPVLTRGWRRDVAVSMGKGGALEAVAVDRSSSRNRLRLSGFAISPGERPRTFEQTAALGPFPPARWMALVSSVSSPGPDLDLIGAPAGGGLQIHVLTASSNYAAFGEQRVVAPRRVGGRPPVFLIGHRLGSPVLYAIDRLRGTVEEIGL
jgi:hypothetical protein